MRISFLHGLIDFDFIAVDLILQIHQSVLCKIHDNALFDRFYDIIGSTLCIIALFHEDLKSGIISDHLLMNLDDRLRNFCDDAVPAQHCHCCLDYVILQYLLLDRFT